MANDGQFGTPAAHPAGWYQDPSNPGGLRFWSGTEWTEHVAPAPAAAPAPEPAAMPAPMSPPASVQANETWPPTSAQGQSTAYGAPTTAYGQNPAYGQYPAYGAAPSAYGQNPAYGSPAPAPWELAQGQVPGGDLDGAPLGFGAAIRSAFRNYATFRGRASRSAYWWFALFAFLVEMPFYVWYLAALIGSVATADYANSSAPPSFPVGALVPMMLLSLVSLPLLLPSLGLAVRRLHDCNRSGWYYFMAFIPFVGSLILLIFYIQEGTPGPNQYSLSSGYGGQQPQATWR